MLENIASTADAVRRRWSKWRLSALERLPFPYWLTLLSFTLITVAEQALEYNLSARFQGVAPVFRVGDALTIVGFVIFVLCYLWVLKQESLVELWRLRPSVLVDDETYEGHVRRMLRADGRVEVGLLGAGVLIALGLYATPLGKLIEIVPQLWAGPLIIAFVGSVYLLLFWLLLVLVYTGVRYGRALQRLSRCPLATDLFDNSHLLPFGRLSLLASLWLVGIVLIPLVVLGPPTSGGYLILGLSLISLLVLFLPLWNIHRQMTEARHTARMKLHAQLMQAQALLLHSDGEDNQGWKALSDRVSTLMGLHKLIHEAPTWPFARGGGFVRAIFATASPVIYFFLNQLILNYLIPLLKK